METNLAWLFHSDMMQLFHVRTDLCWSTQSYMKSNSEGGSVVGLCFYSLKITVFLKIHKTKCEFFLSISLGQESIKCNKDGNLLNLLLKPVSVSN